VNYFQFYLFSFAEVKRGDQSSRRRRRGQLYFDRRRRRRRHECHVNGGGGPGRRQRYGHVQLWGPVRQLQAHSRLPQPRCVHRRHHFQPAQHCRAHQKGDERVAHQQDPHRYDVNFPAKRHVTFELFVFSIKRETRHVIFIFIAKDDLERHAQYMQLSGSGKCDDYRKLAGASALFGVTTHSRFARFLALWLVNYFVSGVKI
jgi:hypothetical protein